MAQGRYVSLPRSELSASIFGKLEGNVETIFGDSVDHIEQTDRDVRVTLKCGSVRNFDLVVGADGLHSRVRELAFGAESKFEKYLGFKVAALEIEVYHPRAGPAYVMYTEVGQQVGRFSLRNNRTMFHFTFADDDIIYPDNLQDQKALLRQGFGNSGWECPQILDALDSPIDLYFDRMSQIRMVGRQASWSRGRITLVGERHRWEANYAEAFRRYQNLFGPFVRKEQKATLRFAGSFAPKSKFALFLRNQIFNRLAIRWFAALTVGSGLADQFEIPDY